MTLQERLAAWRQQRATVLTLKAQFDAAHAAFIAVRQALEQALVDFNRAEADLDQDP